jgi:hypothetical protein
MIRVFVKKQIENNILDLEKTKYFKSMLIARLYKWYKEKKGYEVDIDE